jgi:hypothetical protein
MKLFTLKAIVIGGGVLWLQASSVSSQSPPAADLKTEFESFDFDAAALTLSERKAAWLAVETWVAECEANRIWVKIKGGGFIGGGPAEAQRSVDLPSASKLLALGTTIQVTEIMVGKIFLHEIDPCSGAELLIRLHRLERSALEDAHLDQFVRNVVLAALQKAKPPGA